MRRWLAVLTLGVAAAGCASPTGVSTSPAKLSGADYRIWVRSGEGQPQLKLIDFNQQAVIRTLPGGAFAPDGGRLYTIDGQPNPAVFRALDPRTGATIAQTAVPQGFGFPAGPFYSTKLSGLSPNGSWIALQSVDQGGDGQWKATHYLVVDTALREKAKRIDLGGRWEFDGLSNDGQRLFLVQYLVQPPDGVQYQVRRYDLNGSGLQPGIIVDKREINEGPMVGTRLTSVATPDGDWLYSLYAFGRQGHPFVHALNLDGYGPPAWCIDLPNEPASGDQALELLWSVAMAPGSNRIFAVNAGRGIVAEIAPGNPPSVARTSHFQVSRPSAFNFFGLVVNAEAKRVLFGGAAISPDGKTLYAIGEDGIYVIDTHSLTLRAHYAAGTALDSLLLSTDGSAIFGSSSQAGTLLRIDAATGATGEINSVGRLKLSELLRAELVT